MIAKEVPGGSDFTQMPSAGCPGQSQRGVFSPPTLGTGFGYYASGQSFPGPTCGKSASRRRPKRPKPAETLAGFTARYEITGIAHARACRRAALRGCKVMANTIIMRGAYAITDPRLDASGVIPGRRDCDHGRHRQGDRPFCPRARWRTTPGHRA
jgi:hypothetical protein